ncbi:MAG TPA: MFS transporter [Candidatus Bathyarchaeia archaeon]|nr:MFS transporter [Candidatus Bathyarchaeia archaeon]
MPIKSENDEIKSQGKKLFSAPMIVLLVMVVLVGMGEKMGERFLPLYIIAAGGGTFAVSFLNGMDNLLSALYSFPGGYLSDKIGYKRALLVFNGIAMIGYTIVIIIPTWWAVLLGAVFFISWTAISLPAIMSMISNIVGKDKRVMGVSAHSLVRRIPMALGPIVGGAIIGALGIAFGIKIAFITALGLAVIASLLQIFFVKEPPKENKEPLKLIKAVKTIKPELGILLGADILVRFAEQIPYAFLAIWVVDFNGISELQFGYLTAIEMATALLIYIPVAYFSDKFSKKPFVVITFFFFTLFPLVVYFTRTFPLLIIAFIIRGLKEFGEPTRKALILDLSPEDYKASTFGVYYLIRDVIVSIAAFSSALLWNVDPSVNFFVAAGFGFLGTVLFAIFGKDKIKLRPPKGEEIEPEVFMDSDLNIEKEEEENSSELERD